MKMRQVGYIFIILMAFLKSFSLPAQTSVALDEMRRGDALREKYRFQEASEAYLKASESFVDSLLTADDSLLKLDITDRLLMAENGLSMMDFVYVPDVVARHKFSIEDFFLYYPLPEGSWRQVPCQLDSVAHDFSKAAYVPEGQDEIYWSAVDKEGIRNVFHSEYQDTIWSTPALLNEHMTSVADEIYPMLSPDGSKMYFSSAGLYGVGGYDIYVSDWDKETGDWSVPVNMGFPYSSPADDFLFISTDDGKYSVFASNRDCSKDSVWVYVLEYDDMPVRRPMTDPAELLAIASLDPAGAQSDEGAHDVEADVPENVDTRRYMNTMSQVRVLRDSIDRLGLAVEDARSRNDADAVLSGEMAMIALQDSLSRASAQLQQIEMEFLFSGVVIDPDKLLAEADREIAGQSAEYVFTKNEYGSPLSLKMIPPEPEFDYSFKILEEGQFAEDNTLPSGLVYQIQMFSTTTPATVAKLKGLSPVFETKTANGRYTYRVGVFRTYADVLANLNSVKRVGFRSAFIVAFNDGQDLTVSKARALEAEKKKPSLYEVRIAVGSGELDMTVASGIRQQAPGKDIARVENEDGTKVYVIGPFADHDTAENLAGFIRAMGTSGAECHEIPQK
jgi:hypothetical protein